MMEAVSCTSNEKTNDTADESYSAPSETEVSFDETEEGEIPDITEHNFDGRIFNIYSENWYNYQPLAITDIYSDSINGDTMNDAVFNRCATMSDKLNCGVNAMISEGFNYVRNSVQSSDNAYDIYLSRGRWYAEVMTSGVVFDIADIDTINVDKPWWDADSCATLSIAGRSFALCGDISENHLLSTFSFFFNKNMTEDYNLGNLYDIVNEGGWTIDKLFEMSAVVATDLDNNGEWTRDDLYGFTYMQEHALGLLNACDVTMIKNDSDGIPQITVSDNDGVTKIMKLIDCLSDTRLSYNFHARSPQNMIYTDEVGMFINRHSIFSLGAIYHTPELREMDDEFGIIPYPKYDEAQSKYINPVDGANLSIVTFPKRSDDINEVGIFAEYFAYLGNKLLRPALYDKLLQGKVVRDDESSAMLDMIFGDLTYDVGYVADYGNIATNLCNMFFSLQPTVVSNLQRFNKLVQNKIDTTVEAVKSLE